MSARICRLAAVILFAAVAFAAVGKAQPAAEPLPVAASQEIGGTAQMSGPGATETLAEREATVSGFVEARLQVLGDHLHGLFAALPGLPAELAVAGARLRDELAGRGLLEVCLLLASFVGLGVVAELLFVWATGRIAARVETAPLATPGDRIRCVRTRLTLGLARVVCFALGSIGGFLAFTWPPQLRRLVLGYLVAAMALRLMLAFGRFLFAPRHERFRVVPMSDAAAGFWLRWSAAFVGWFAFGYVTLEHLRQLGMSLAATQALAYLLGLGLLLIVLRTIWRPAMPVAPRGRIVATVLAVAIWVAWVVGAGLLMMLLLVGSALAVTIPGAHRAVLHLFRPVAPADEHAAAAPLSVWAVVVDRGVRALLIVGGIWLLSWALGLDVVAIVGRDTPATRLLIGAACTRSSSCCRRSALAAGAARRSTDSSRPRRVSARRARRASPGRISPGGAAPARAHPHAAADPADRAAGGPGGDRDPDGALRARACRSHR